MSTNNDWAKHLQSYLNEYAGNTMHRNEGRAKFETFIFKGLRGDEGLAAYLSFFRKSAIFAYGNLRIQAKFFVSYGFNNKTP